MPIYIDKNKLFADILDEKVRSEKEDSQRVLAWFERLLQRQPIADVVPRSEVDGIVSQALKEVRILLAVANNEVAELKKAKQEVAREIFEEIEKNADIIGSPYVDKEYCLKQGVILELKKKYIGE